MYHQFRAGRQQRRDVFTASQNSDQPSAQGTAGAIRMAGEAALRTGLGWSEF
ncbi:hypothetical protein L245_01805 [Salmonella enterica subsp. enterica serovar Worthington str. BCH-4719]|nr:hypothetical protein L245_01805 [Salmonella enterica subsp. enterica serovar Worthington str. BCH-4719]